MVRLTSSAFGSRTEMPERYTCEGQDISPPLSWDQVPEEAKSLVLVFDDPDAMNGPFTHWLVYNISPERDSLPEKFAPAQNNPDEIAQGRNTFGDARYRGPCPPTADDAHLYHFRLYALDTDLNIPPGANRDQLYDMIEGHILDETELVTSYGRSANL